MTGEPAAGVRSLVAAAVLIAALWAAAWVAYRPATLPRGALPPDEFSSARALAVLRDLWGDSIPHPMGSAANAAVRDRIVARLQQLGYAPRVQTDALVCDAYAHCGTPANIVVRIPGTEDDSAAVLLAAHYDSVPAGPGASDDGTAVAVVLEIARMLRLTPRLRHPIVLLIDDGEEVGLLGARAFVDHDPLAKTIAAAVNIDNRGTSGPSMMFETGSANRWLMNLYAQRVAHPNASSLYYAIYKMLPNDTDFTVFKSAGYQGFNFAYIGDVANYHTPHDDLAHVSAASVQQHGDNAWAVLRALAGAHTGSPPVGEAVYFDLDGRLLVRMPEYVMLPAAVVTLLLILIATTRLLRRGDIGFGEMAWSLGCLLLAYSAAAALPVGLILLIRAVNPASMPLFSPSPWVLESTCAAVVIAVLCLLSLVLSRRARFWGFWSANALWTTLLALLLAVKLPGASYLAVLPAIAGATALGLRLRAGRSGPRPEWMTLGYLLVTFGLFWPLLMFLYDGLGRPGLPLLALLPLFAAAPVVGLLLMAGRDVQRVGAALGVLGLLTGAAIAVMVPAYTVSSPQPLNLHYAEQRTEPGGTAHAQWIVSQLARTLAPQLSARGFTAVPQEALNPLLIFQTTEFTADAPLLDLVAPTLDLTSAVLGPAAAGQPQRARYEVHIASHATVSALQLAFAPQAQVRSLRIGAVNCPLVAWKDGWTAMYLVDPPATGWNLSFEAAAGPFDITMANVSYGLPAAAAQLLQARPADTIANGYGDDTRMLTTVHLPNLRGR